MPDTEYPTLESMNPEKKIPYLIKAEIDQEINKSPTKVIDKVIITDSFLGVENIVQESQEIQKVIDIKPLPWIFISTKCSKNQWFLVEVNPITEDGKGDTFILEACSIFETIELVNRYIVLNGSNQVIAAAHNFELDVI